MCSTQVGFYLTRKYLTRLERLKDIRSSLFGLEFKTLNAGAMTLSMMTFNITRKKGDTQHNDSVVMLSVTNKFRNDECLYAECRYAECRYSECHGAKKLCHLLKNSSLDWI